MSLSHPLRLIVVGFVLLLTGVVLPFLMVIRLIQPTFFLCFLSYTASTGGLIIGTIGAVLYSRTGRRG